MSFVVQVLALILLATFLLGVAFLEMRYIKTRGARVEARIEKDDAFNAISTTRSVADSLGNQGFDTTEADPIILKAELAFRSGNFIHARTLAEKARSLLTETHDRGPDPLERRKFPMGVEERHTLHEEVISMPKSMMEAKFMIGVAEDLMGDQEDAGSREGLDCAIRLFEAEDYEGAFAEACRVKKALEGREVQAENQAVEDIVYVCPNCKADVGEDDGFCKHCGTPLD